MASVRRTVSNNSNNNNDNDDNDDLNDNQMNGNSNSNHNMNNTKQQFRNCIQVLSFLPTFYTRSGASSGIAMKKVEERSTICTPTPVVSCFVHSAAGIETAIQLTISLELYFDRTIVVSFTALGRASWMLRGYYTASIY